MLKLATLVGVSALLLASGCAAHDQRVALEQSCNTGDQNACQQIAQDEAPRPYPPNQSVHVMPAGQLNIGLPSGPRL